jgi:hypothetical protein
MALSPSRPNNALHTPSQNLQESEEALLKTFFSGNFSFSAGFTGHLAIDPPK